MPQLDWNTTLNSIRETVPQAQFLTWFKPLEYLRSDENSVVLGVPSKFHEDWIRSHYSGRIAQAIRKQCGSELQLEFEVLVRDENVEASLSDPSPTVMHARPALRIIDGSANDSGTASETAPSFPGQPQQPPQAPPLAPNVPPFPNAFLEMPYNHVAFAFSGLFSEETQDIVINPLILYGGIGMGKTHLLSDIATRLYRQNPRLRIRYTNSEMFTAEMVHGIKNNSIYSFQKKYRQDTDVLLFDDIPGLGGRNRSQQELLHIFNEISARGGRIAFTTSVPIARLEEFCDPLKSRLASGIIAEIKYPTIDEKLQLLSLVAMQNQMLVDESVLRSLSESGSKDIRELIGTLFRMHLQAKLENQPLDHGFLAKEGMIQEVHRETITIDEIISLVEVNFGVNRTELVSKSRKGATAWARQVAMYLARHYTLMPLEEIGKTFGRDHSTVIHAFQKVTDAMEAKPSRKYEVEFLKQKLHNRSPRGNNVLPI